MHCTTCLYYYQDVDDDFPTCHFQAIGPAPCEEDDV